MEYDELLYRAETTEDEYLEALQIGASGHRIILKRDPEDVYVNPYNPDILLNWEANVDMQFVLDPYTCVQYLLDYMMKSERAMGELLKRVSKEMKDESIAKQMEVIGAKFLGTREVCVQNAVMDCLSMWLFKKSRESVFVSGEPRESRVSMMKPKYELEAMEDEDENVFYNSVHDKYAARPDSMEDVCLASFATDYKYSTSVGDDADNLDSLPPVDSEEESDEEEPALKRKKGPPRQPRIRLKNNMGTLIKRKRSAILRTHSYKIHKDRERYFHAKLMLYYPWREEDDLMAGYESYEMRFQHVQDTVIANADPFNTNVERIEEAIETHREQGPAESAWDTIAPCLEEQIAEANFEGIQEEREVDEDDLVANEQLLLQNRSKDGKEQCDLSLLYTKQATKQVMTNEQYMENVYNLKERQRTITMYLRSWLRTSVIRVKNGLLPVPFQIFLTGPGGTGKSHVVHLFKRDVIHFSNIADSTTPDNPKILLLALTGTAAFNIEGLTIHSGLSISQRGGISDQRANIMTERLGNLWVVVTDEQSMIGHRLWYVRFITFP